MVYDQRLEGGCPLAGKKEEEEQLARTFLESEHFCPSNSWIWALKANVGQGGGDGRGQWGLLHQDHRNGWKNSRTNVGKHGSLWWKQMQWREVWTKKNPKDKISCRRNYICYRVTCLLCLQAGRPADISTAPAGWKTSWYLHCANHSTGQSAKNMHCRSKEHVCKFNNKSEKIRAESAFYKHLVN